MKRNFLLLLFTLASIYCRAQTITYTYDNLGRLTMATYPDKSAISYSYDAAGNRTSARISNSNYKPQTIAFKNITVTYGAADTAAGAVASSGLPVSYVSSNTMVATIVNGKLHIIGAGTSYITALQPGNGTYLAAPGVKDTLTVKKAPLAITANSFTKVYGLANPTLTVKFAGFVNGDTQARLTTQAIVSTTATTTSPAGKYPITVSGAAAANYTITYIAGALTVTPSANAGLLKLTNSAGTLTPVFATNTLTYTVSAANATKTVTIQPTAADANASIKINGTTVAPGAISAVIPLAIGTNNITIVVTAADGVTKKTYNITIIRAGGSINFASNTALNDADQQPAKSDNILVHEGISPNADGINDYLVIDGITAYPDNKVMIMNANGSTIFETSNYNNTSNVFNGHSNKTNTMQQPGTYYYLLEYKDKGKLTRKTGYLILKY